MANEVIDSPARLASVLALMRIAPTQDLEVARAVLAVLEEVVAGTLTTTLTWHKLRVLLEDRQIGALDDDVWETLLLSGLFQGTGRTITVVDPIALDRLFKVTRPRDRVAVPLSSIMGVVTAPPPTLQPTTPRELVPAIGRIRDWGLSLLRYADAAQLDGFPVFWDRVGQDSRPFGSDIGSTAASETIALWLEADRAGLAVRLNSEDESAVRRALGQLLELGRADGDEWYSGSVAFPVFDDDFVGSFLQDQAARGSCPTIEAGAARLLTLLRLADGAGERGWDTEVAPATTACGLAADHLVRWQAASGGWAIHNYGAESPYTMPTRDFSSRYACDALLAVVTSDRLDQERIAAATAALRRYADLLLATAHDDNDRTWWADDFALDGPPSIRATCMAAIGLGGLGEALADPSLDRLQAGAVGYLADSWQPNATAVLAAEFRCPTWAGPALNMFSWEPPADALVLLAVTDYAQRGANLSDELVAKLHLATALLLAEEENGALLDAEMKKAGMSKAFASNTLHGLRALVGVLRWQLGAVPVSASTLLMPVIEHR